MDEAADWQIGEDIFPRYPPAGLRAVVSARTGPDERQAGWLTKIGWTDPDSAEQMTVDRLERQAFSALVQSDTLVSRLFATQLDIDEQLFKKTGGDPLLLSLYLQEVRLQLLRRNAADISLGDVPSGLAGVVSLWEDDLRARLKSAAADTLSAARRLRSVLAAAFGPLRRADLHQLCGAEVSSEAIDDAVDALSRFLVGDGDNDGYAFTHPLLGQHFYARLAERERVELDRRFVAWGRSAIEEIGNGVGTPRDVAPYLVQYLSAHMQRARVAVDELRVLLSEHWKDACFALEGTYSKFVNDVDIVRRAILEHDRKLVSDGGQPKYFADAFFCMLCESSTSEQSDNLSSFVVAAALATKIISPQQCIQLVERRTPPVIGSSKIGLLVTIVDLVPAARETLQPLIGQIVERDHPKGRDFSDAIVLNYPRVLSILDPSTRARIVAPISAWIEDRWRNWSRQAQDDPAAARLLVKDASAVPSTLQFGCIRPFLEPARARALAALYIDACDHAALDWKNRQPADVIGLLPALPSEIQFELLDAWFDDQTKTPLVQAAGWLVEMDGELGLALKQRYGPRLARHVERNGHWLDWRDIDLMSLALRWCEPPDDVPVMARLGLFIKGLLWSAPFPLKYAAQFVLALPLHFRENASLTLIDTIRNLDFDDDLLELFIAYPGIVGARQLAELADAAYQADINIRSKWLAVQALRKTEPDVELARQALHLAVEIRDTIAQARSFVALAADAPVERRRKFLDRLMVLNPWLTDDEARLPAPNEWPVGRRDRGTDGNRSPGGTWSAE